MNELKHVAWGLQNGGPGNVWPVFIATEREDGRHLNIDAVRRLLARYGIRTSPPVEHPTGKPEVRFYVRVGQARFAGQILAKNGVTLLYRSMTTYRHAYADRPVIKARRRKRERLTARERARGRT